MTRRFVALAAAIAFAMGACQPSTPTPAASSSTPTPTASTPSVPTASPEASGSARPVAEVYAAIQQQVEQIRGLQPKAAVAPVVIDADTLRKNLTAEFDSSNPAASVKITEDLYIALGLIPPGSSLRTLTLDLQAGQVAGYYSPEKDQLFVVSRSGEVGPVEEVTYSHEFTHQLQDQNFDLGKIGLDTTGQSDRAMGRLGLIEGDATSVQQTYTQTLSSSDLAKLFAASLDPAAVQALERAPRVLRDQVFYPYQDGLTFVLTIMQARGGYGGVNDVFKSPPDSTEQVLHPDHYLNRDEPVAVDLPANLASAAGSGWTEIGRDTIGELVLRTWLREGGVPLAQANAGAAGWGGDRVAILTGPDGGLALAIVTTWDTANDASEFRAAATATIAGLKLQATVLPAADPKEVRLAIGPVAGALATKLGG